MPKSERFETEVTHEQRSEFPETTALHELSSAERRSPQAERNARAKQAMAAELLALGLSPEAVARVLNLGTEC